MIKMLRCMFTWFMNVYQSLQGADLEITLDFQIIHEYDPNLEMAFLHSVVQSNRIELLKHPICESFLHLKWLEMKPYFYAYFCFYLVFLLTFNALVYMDLSPALDTSQEEIKNYLFGTLGLFLVCLAVFIVKIISLMIYNFKQYFKVRKIHLRFSPDSKVLKKKKFIHEIHASFVFDLNLLTKLSHRNNFFGLTQPYLKFENAQRSV